MTSRIAFDDYDQTCKEHQQNNDRRKHKYEGWNLGIK